MGIYNIINKIKTLAINTDMNNMVAFGDIQLFDDKSIIKYPYTNLDVVTSSVQNFAQTYTIRVYVCDRNTPYIAYNKTEAILNGILKNIEIDAVNYTVNYFTTDYKDMVHGVWTDIQFTIAIQTDCKINYDLGEGYILQENSKYIQQENGDLIKKEINN